MIIVILWSLFVIWNKNSLEEKAPVIDNTIYEQSHVYHQSHGPLVHTPRLGLVPNWTLLIIFMI